MIKITEKAFAKLNLCLEVGETLENGYHAVQSVMQSVSLCDTVVLKRAEKGISLKAGHSRIPTDSRNLAYKAAELFFKEWGKTGGVEIELQKSIPVCAGLGGGSADAAAVLRGLNRLYGRPFSLGALAGLSAVLGADVPFCIRGGSAFAKGIGDRLEQLPDLKLYYVLIFDRTPLSTPKMYAALDKGQKSPADAKACRKAFLDGDVEAAAALTANSFLGVAKEACPAVERNLKALREKGAVYVGLTGKGPTVYGVFTEEAAARKCAKAVRGRFCQTVSAL